MSKTFDNICHVAVDAIMEVRHGIIANEMQQWLDIFCLKQVLPLHNRSPVPNHTLILGLPLQTQIAQSQLSLSEVNIHYPIQFPLGIWHNKYMQHLHKVDCQPCILPIGLGSTHSTPQWDPRHWWKILTKLALPSNPIGLHYTCKTFQTIADTASFLDSTCLHVQRSTTSCATELSHSLSLTQKCWSNSISNQVCNHFCQPIL